MPPTERENGTALWEQAQQQYPYLKRKSIQYLYSPTKKTDKLLEFWPIGEEGEQSSPRPVELPLNQLGIQVLSPSVRPVDILGDYVSHEAVKSDPTLRDLYERFEKSIPEQVMQQRYATHQRQYGEQRPYETWYKQTGLPEYFRGYVFNQWPNPSELYTPEQLSLLDTVKIYLGVK